MVHGNFLIKQKRRALRKNLIEAKSFIFPVRKPVRYQIFNGVNAPLALLDTKISNRVKNPSNGV